MSATVRELLAEAERLTWDVANGPRDAWALATAWPDFQHRATQALEAIPDASYTWVTLHRNALTRAAQQADLDNPEAAVRRSEADPRVLRVGQLLGAAADLVSAAGADEPGSPASLQVERTVWMARVAEITGTMARAARTALENAGDDMPAAPNYYARLWDVEQYSTGLTDSAMPDERKSVLEDAVAAAAPMRPAT